MTTKPVDVKDLPAVPANTCSAKDLTSSTTPPTTTEWSLRTSTSDEGTALSATATKEQRSDTRKTNTSLTAEAETNAALTPEAETNTTQTAVAETSAALIPEAADSTQPVSEAAQPNTQPASEAAQPSTQPTDRAETNASASAPAAGTNTPPPPGALQPTAPATAEADSATSATRAAATDTRPPSGVGPMAESDRSDQSEANDASPPTMQEQPATDLSSQWKASTTGHSAPKHAAGEFETGNFSAVINPFTAMTSLQNDQ